MNYSPATRLAYTSLFNQARAGVSDKLATQLAQTLLRHESTANIVREGR